MESNRYTYGKDTAGARTGKGQGLLTVIGAGPGDIELITLKAINALKNADVVLYDALVNP